MTEFMTPDSAKAKLPDILAWSPEKNNELRTPLWDNIEFALAILKAHASGDTIVVISDGGDIVGEHDEYRVDEQTARGLTCGYSQLLLHRHSGRLLKRQRVTRTLAKLGGRPVVDWLPQINH